MSFGGGLIPLPDQLAATGFALGRLHGTPASDGRSRHSDPSEL
jgi:hypothetical protein